jgi:hypothetical protein
MAMDDLLGLQSKQRDNVHLPTVANLGPHWQGPSALTRASRA